MGVVGAGPVGDLAADAVDNVKTFGDLAAHPKGEKQVSHAVRQGLQDVKKYTPMGSIWWARTAFQCAVLDQIQKALDPDAQDAFDRSARRLKHETGQDSWWASGEAMPGRAPDVSAAWGSHAR